MIVNPRFKQTHFVKHVNNWETVDRMSFFFLIRSEHAQSFAKLVHVLFLDQSVIDAFFLCPYHITGFTYLRTSIFQNISSPFSTISGAVLLCGCYSHGTSWTLSRPCFNWVAHFVTVKIKTKESPFAFTVLE